MARLGLIEENKEIFLPEDGFMLSSENGVEKVYLMSIIGKGGTAIAYKGIREKNGCRTACIVKEYFPKDKEDKYIRKNTGDKISIIEEYKDAELRLQKENINRELLTNQQIYFNESDIKNKEFNNFPYAYSAEYFCRYGDTSYIVLDSSEGETLHSKLKKGIENDEMVLKYVYQLLIAVEHLHEKGFIHSDIKPENLWLRGFGDNQNMCLLDFGSAFRLSVYHVDNIEQLSPREIMQAANRIVANESIGFSTDGYCSINMINVKTHKRAFLSTDHSPKRARKLIDAVNALGIGDDLFSVVRVMKVLFDIRYPKYTEKPAYWEELQKMYNKCEGDNERYESVDELRTDLKIIETIMHNGAHPKVLERGLKKDISKLEIDEFDESLLCDIE